MLIELCLQTKHVRAVEGKNEPLERLHQEEKGEEGHMKEWPKPYKLHVHTVVGEKIFDDHAYYDHESHARIRMRDLAESNTEADEVVVRISRQKRLRGDFAV